MRNQLQHIRNKYFGLKKGFIFLILNFLRNLARSPFGFLTVIFLRLLSFFPVHPQRLDALYVYIYGLKEAAPTIRAAHALVHVERWKNDFDSPNTSLDLVTLSNNKIIHILLEPGASLPDFVAKLPTKDARLKIYSFAGQAALVKKLNIENRTVLVSLRDKFNDIDKEGEELFQFCKATSEHIISKISSGKLSVFNFDSTRQVESSAIFLEDAISHKMSMAMCLKRAMETIPSDEAIVYVARSSEYLVDGWAFFKDFCYRDNFYVADVSPYEALQADFWLSMRQRLTGQNYMRTFAHVPLSTAVASIRQNLSAQLKNIVKFVDKECNILSQIMPSESEVFFLTMGKTGVYTQARDQLSKNLRLHQEKYSNASAVFLNLAPKTSRLTQDTSSRNLTYNLSNYTALITKFRSTEINLDSYIRGVINDLPSNKNFNGAELNTFITPSIKNFLQVQISWWMISYNFGKSLSRLRPASKYVGLSTRQPAIRSFCAGVKDQNPASSAVFDVQCLNVLRHPKYRKTVADHSVVIDKQAAEIYKDYFKVESKSVFIGGAPQYDEFLSKYNILSTDEIKNRLNLNKNSFNVLFISQLQPLALMFEMLGPACLAAQESNLLHIIIRLHPREGEARKVAYKEYLEALLPAHKFSFSKTEAVEEILKVTDVCITWYSNMAREATLVEKEVFVPEYLTQQAPLNLSLYNLGTSVSSKSELKNKILEASVVSPENRKAPFQYLLENPSIAKRQCSEAILNFIFEQKSQSDNLENEAPRSNLVSPKELIGKDDINLIVLSSAPSATALHPYCHGKNVKVFGYTNIISQINNARKIDIAKPGFDQGIDVAVSATIANEISESCLGFLDEAIVPDSFFGKLLKRNRKALWMSMRPELMNATNLEANILNGIESNKPTLIYGGTKDQICWTLKRAQKKNPQLLNYFVALGADQAETGLINGTNFLYNYGANLKLDTKANKNALNIVSYKQLEFETWLSNLSKIKFDIPIGAQVLVTTDWNLKTVPPTLIPILNRISGNNKKIVVANRRQKGIDAASQSLQTLGGPKNNFTLLDAESLHTNYAPPPLACRKHLETCWGNWLISQPFFTSQSPLLKLALKKPIKNAINVHLVRIAIWDCYCNAFMAQGGKLSVACPGRQWHTWVSHRVSEVFSGQSLTIQNAYMTDGYTYFPPTANYITCIDDWSKSLLTNYYKIDPKFLHITSTPRFDAMTTAIEKPSLPSGKEISQDCETKIVLFATQPGFENQTNNIIQSIASTFIKSKKASPHLIVKLHPRTSRDETNLIKNTMNNFNNHNITIEKTGSISTLIQKSDIIITMFSNVGIEGAIAKKPLIIAKANIEKLPLPLDDFEIGYVAETYDDISIAINKFITDKAFQTLYQRKLEKFAERNPIMMSGRSAELIANVILERLK